MKKIRKILSNAGPLALVALAAIIILLLMRMQPGVKGGRSQQPGATNSRPDADRMLTEMPKPCCLYCSVFSRKMLVYLR
jgi:hypothetical protein